MKYGALILIAIVCSVCSTTSYANLIVNGEFATGDFTGWTLFSTPEGYLGIPAVVSFDVTNSGASNAAQFQVGGPGTPIPGGGGIAQTVTTGSGMADFTADIAAFDPTSSQDNADGGTFGVLFDGTIEDTFSVGSIISGTTVRSTLSFMIPVTAGDHDIEILITRTFNNTPETPTQYVTNVSFDVPTAVPEPSTLALFAISVIFLALARVVIVEKENGWRRRIGVGGIVLRLAVSIGFSR